MQKVLDRIEQWMLECVDEVLRRHDVMPRCPGFDASYIGQNFLALIGQGCFPFTAVPLR